MAHAKGFIGETRYTMTIDVDGHHIVADEPASNGGGNTGPAPYDLLLAAIASCTAITLRMYADHKQWPLKSVTVDLHFNRTPDKKESIDRVLHLEGDLTEEQRARIADIAERTPVTLTLKNGLPINTTLAPV